MIKLRLKEVLDKYGFTQKQLSELTKIKEATISSYCNNTAKNISIDNVNRICVTLSCDTNDIFEFIDVKDTEFPDSNVFMTYQEYQKKLYNSNEEMTITVDKDILQAIKDGNTNVINEYVIRLIYKDPIKAQIIQSIVDNINTD